MRRAAPLVCLLIVGCGDPYRETIRRQASNYEELADLLAQVKDARSMVAIEDTIDDRAGDFQRAANRARELPPPDPERMQGYRDELKKIEAAANRYAAECRRIRGLDGGPAFVDRIGKLVAGEGP
jgi:hypothetical protein